MRESFGAHFIGVTSDLTGMSGGYLGTDDDEREGGNNVVHHSCCLTLEDAHEAEWRLILAQLPKGFAREM